MQNFTVKFKLLEGRKALQTWCQGKDVVLLCSLRGESENNIPDPDYSSDLLYLTCSQLHHTVYFLVSFLTT